MPTLCKGRVLTACVVNVMYPRPELGKFSGVVSWQCASAPRRPAPGKMRVFTEAQVARMRPMAFL